MDIDWPQLVRTARSVLRESQEEFAKRFGVQTNTVSRWETGYYDVPLKVVDWLISQKELGKIEVCPTCKGRGIIFNDLP